MLIVGGGLPIVLPVVLVFSTRRILKVIRRVVMRALHTLKLCILTCLSLMLCGSLMTEKALMGCQDVADSSMILCATACTVTLVHEFSLPLLQLTAEEGGAIASAILAIWAIGFGFRALFRTLKNTDGNINSEEN